MNRSLQRFRTTEEVTLRVAGWMVLSLLIVGCRAPKDEPLRTSGGSAPDTPAVATSGTRPATPAPPLSVPTATIVEETSAPPGAPAEVNVTIERVEIANPIVVSGRARTFENNVALRVRNARGEVIAEDFTTAQGDMGRHNPYRGTVLLTSDPGPRVTVEALEYSAKDGSERSLVSVERPFTVAPIDAQLHFGTAECAGTVVAKRRMPKSISHARLLAEALLRGPSAAEARRGMVSPFPKGAAVRSINLRDGVLTVDFNEVMRNVGGSCRAQTLREMISKTLGALPNVKRVVITAGGSEKLALQP